MLSCCLFFLFLRLGKSSTKMRFAGHIFHICAHGDGIEKRVSNDTGATLGMLAALAGVVSQRILCNLSPMWTKTAKKHCETTSCELLVSKHLLGGGFKFQIDFLFSPLKFGKDSHFDEHIFQMGWNHQSACDCLGNAEALLVDCRQADGTDGTQPTNNYSRCQVGCFKLSEEVLWHVHLV